MMQKFSRAVLTAALLLCAAHVVDAAEAKRPAEWDKTVEAARKEGKIVIAIPPVNELRREMDNVLKQKFGIEAELLAAPGPKNASRISAEKKPA